MPQFSATSKARLASCDEQLQRLFNEVIRHVDCVILCGHRGQDEQEEAFHDGKSKVKWPHSRHNSLPSHAVDAAPYPLDWGNKEGFYSFAGYVASVAHGLGIAIRTGADWNGDGKRNETFIDLPHFELLG